MSGSPFTGLSSTVVTYPSGSWREDASILQLMPDPRPGAGRWLLAVTDITPFHPLDPLWPDQPADYGELRVGGHTSYQVRDTVTLAQRANGPVLVDSAIDARRDEPGVTFAVAHVVDAGAATDLHPGKPVTLVVDQDRRRRLSAAHTACHLLAYALNGETHDLWRKPTGLDSRGYHDFDAAACMHTQHDVDGSLDKYRLGKSLRKRGFDSTKFMREISGIIDGINRVLAGWITSDASVRIECAGTRLTDRRQWVCEIPGGTAQMPCGGTHVRRLGEINSMTAVASVDQATGILTIRNTVSVPGPAVQRGRS